MSICPAQNLCTTTVPQPAPLKVQRANVSTFPSARSCVERVLNWNLRRFCDDVSSDEWYFSDEISTSVIPRRDQVSCVRKAYTGDPFICCSKDYAATERFENCFSTPGQGGGSRTCDPSLRDITSDACNSARVSIEDVCLGVGLTDQQWIDVWTKPTYQSQALCPYFLSRKVLNIAGSQVLNLQTAVPPPSQYISGDRIAWARNFLSRLASNYNARGFSFGSAPNSRNFSPIEPVLYNICSNAPGLCNSFLRQFCSPFTGDQLTREPALANWCGCYLPDSEYETYVTQYQVNRECTPYCIREGAVPLARASGTSPSPCTQNTCIIDDVTIRLERSSVGQGVNFSQFCGNCGEGTTCSCILSGASIEVINSRIGGQIDLSQNCSGSSLCYIDVGPTQIQVPCATGDDASNQVEKEFRDALFRRNLTILLVLLGAIILVGIVWFVVSFFFDK